MTQHLVMPACSGCSKPIDGVAVSLKGQTFCRACVIKGHVRDGLRQGNRP